MSVEITNAAFFWFFLILFSISINPGTAMHLLLLAEILWVTLFILALVVGLAFDSIAVLSLTFFFLVFSAIELGVGLALALLFNVTARSTSLGENDSNFLKFSYRTRSKLYANRIIW